MRSDTAPDMRQRARELRALAEDIAEERTRSSLLQTAEACERFADREEQLKRAGAKPRKVDRAS